MKSMLHEAPTVAKAIAKAWDESGQPSEFSIKVLEKEKKGILWFSKQPAIISISYDPKKQTKKRTGKPTEKRAKKPFQKRTPVPYHTSNKKKQQSRNPRDQRDQRQKDKKEVRDQKQRPQQQQKRESDKNVNVWANDWVNNINSNLKEILSILKIKSNFTTRIDKKTLHVEFERSLLSSAEEERMLFISLSYLLVQFLKKKLKKKLRGFHLVLKSKRSSNHEKERFS